MFELTTMQQEVWDLREKEGKKFREIAEITGKSRGTIVESYRSAKLKKEKLLRAKDDGDPGRRVENKMSPEAAAKLIDMSTDPFAKLEEVALQCGMKPATVQALVRRMKTRYLGVNEQMKAIKTTDMIRKLDERIGHALSYVDDYVMAEANFRDLAMGVAQMIEKRNLLKGEPTQIISREERKAINELGPELILEMKRRGITIDVVPRVEKLVAPA
jgi:transposase